MFTFYPILMFYIIFLSSLIIYEDKFQVNIFYPISYNLLDIVI